jgi:hypothetical protein
MNEGSTVKLRAYGGEIIERRIVAVRGNTVAVCKDEEYQAAQREGREPLSVGFPLSAVVER